MSKLHIADNLSLPLEAPLQSRADVQIPGCADIKDLLRRFWRYVRISDSSECWAWSAGTTAGYGVLSLGRPSRRKILAHRASYLFFIGHLLPSDLVCHSCDNPPCTNPTHLFVGSQTDNMSDAARKGRLFGRRVGIGEKQHLARLTTEQVRHIRKLADEGESITSLAGQYGYTYQGIKAIIDRKNWKYA